MLRHYCRPGCFHSPGTVGCPVGKRLGNQNLLPDTALTFTQWNNTSKLCRPPNHYRPWQLDLDFVPLRPLRLWDLNFYIFKLYFELNQFFESSLLDNFSVHTSHSTVKLIHATLSRRWTGLIIKTKVCKPGDYFRTTSDWALYKHSHSLPRLYF